MEDESFFSESKRSGSRSQTLLETCQWSKNRAKKAQIIQSKAAELGEARDDAQDGDLLGICAAKVEVMLGEVEERPFLGSLSIAQCGGARVEKACQKW